MAMALFASLAFITAAPANAASGKVSCGVNNPVGMWVEVSGGTSGWATLANTSSPRVKNWSYNTQGKQWRARVGCGGTSENWKYSITSNWTTLQGATVSCADEGWFKKCVAG